MEQIRKIDKKQFYKKGQLIINYEGQNKTP